MKPNLKVINSAFDETTRISTTTILTDIGQFTGIAKLHPDDAQYASRYAGCRYAEIRATIKYLKAKKTMMRTQIKELYRLLNQIKSRKDRNSIEEVVNIYKNQIENCNKYILLLKDNLQKSIKEREKIIDKNV